MKKQKVSNRKEKREEQKPTTPDVIQRIELSRIECSPFNPRKYRTEEELDELAKSIAGFGVIQPVTLRRKGDGYEIVCGERRYRASLQAGLSTIPAIVREYSDAEALEITILENLQRRDINPVEEAVSFGKLMEMRGYSIDDLVKQFGKTDRYIRSRLQLRNLIGEVSELLAREEITLGVALELARFCPDTQQDVYREHLGNDSFSWKHMPAKEFRRMLEKGYSADLSAYEFDRTDCLSCSSNSSLYDLFAEGKCGSCQNVACLRYKQAEYMTAETSRLLSERPDAGICVAPESFASAEIVDSLMDTGREIYEVAANPMPEEPGKPEPEQFESETDYQLAEASYETSLQHYKNNSAHIEAMLAQGKAQLMVDVSRRKPVWCYIVPDAETERKEKKDTVESLRAQDRRNREIAVENAVEDAKRLVMDNAIPAGGFTPLEERLVYYILLADLRKENYELLGFNPKSIPTQEEKADITASLTDEQKDLIRRDFIVRHLSGTSEDCKQSHLFLEFVALHFPDAVGKIKEQYSEVYKKRHIRIEEKIRELQPFEVGQEAKEAVIVENKRDVKALPAPESMMNSEAGTEPETIEETDADNVPVYPGLPEHARIGEMPEEEEAYADIAYEEIAA